MKKSGRVLLISLGCFAGGSALWIRKKKKREIEKWALFFAVMDDEICRNELEGNFVNGRPIVFGEKKDSLYDRYQYFLELLQHKSKAWCQREEKRLKKRLATSRQYAKKPKETLQLVLVNPKRKHKKK